MLHLPVNKPHKTHDSSNCSDKRLSLKMSALQTLFGGQFSLSTQLIKPNYLVIPHTNPAPPYSFLLLVLQNNKHGIPLITWTFEEAAKLKTLHHQRKSEISDHSLKKYCTKRTVKWRKVCNTSRKFLHVISWWKWLPCPYFEEKLKASWCKGKESVDFDQLENSLKKISWKGIKVGVAKREGKSKSLFLNTSFGKILRLSRTERKTSRVSYISGGMSRLTLVHEFENRACLL